VLRHPQEKDRVLGTARMIELQLPQSRIVTGLSWRNLAAARGKLAEPRDWGVLYQGPKTDRLSRGAPPLIAVDRKGKPMVDQKGGLAGLKGLIVLDGTWSQAKTLWWRNPWLLKCRRLVLMSERPSAYGKLRREPRRDSLSTLESAALALSVLEGDEALYERLTAPLRKLVGKAGGAA
jgi:DTW domain-containing protein YfiP